MSPYGALNVGAFLAYVPAALRMIMSKGGYNNVSPRAQVEKLSKSSPLFARLHGAHMNTLESWPFFAAGVIAAKSAGVDSDKVSRMATSWCAIRALYILVYMAQRGSIAVAGLRSLCFLASFTVSCRLMILAAKEDGDSS